MPKFSDKTGYVVNGCKVIGFARMSADTRPRPEWTFECNACGATFIAQFGSVKLGLRTCKPCRQTRRVEDLTNKKFGFLRATQRLGVNKHKQAVWSATCDSCGKVFEKTSHLLKRSTGCPCGKARETHGMSRSSTYKTWNSMMSRCTNMNTHRYDRYGGRGVTICERWRTFSNFLADMGERPPNATLDRIDNEGNYEPSNCRWATRIDQRRNMEQNTLITYNGQTRTLAEWAERIGMDRHTLRSRYVRHGWSAERSLTEPIARGSKNTRKPFTP